MFESESIKLIPEIREEIIDAINNDQLVLFVGAGVSTIAGLPLWHDLASDLMNKIRESRYLDAQQFDLVSSKITDAKMLITIAYETFKKHNDEQKFWQIFEEELSEEKIKNEGQMIFDFIIKTNALTLTTNADKLLDSNYQPELIFYDLNKSIKWLKNGPALVKIHGSLDKVDSLVFTTSHYLERYSNNKFQDYLHSIFHSGKTILFIGYGLGEFELLEYMLNKSSRDDNKKRGKIYVLNPYFSYEECIKENMDLYYESLNIEQIAYRKDENGYNQLATVLEQWLKSIEEKTEIHSGRFSQIIRCLNSSDDLDLCVSTILQVISESIYAENYFFDELRKKTDAQWWVCKLAKSELFDPTKKLLPAEIIESKGTKSYRSIGWNGISIIHQLIEKEQNNNEFERLSKSIVIDLIEDIIHNPKKATNFQVISLIIDILTAQKENICGKNLFDFLSIISESEIESLSQFYYSASREQSYFQDWDNSDITKVMNLMFDFITIGEVDHSKFGFEAFAREKLDEICKLIPLSIFEKSLNWLQRTENADPYCFMQIGAIAKYPEKNNYDSNKEIIALWAKTSIKYVSVEELQEFIEENIKDGTRTIKKFAIYSIAIRFTELRSFLFNFDFNPFSDWDVYGDLYFLLESNNSEFTQKECDILFEWITSSDYKKKKEQGDYINTIKYDFIELLSKHHDQFKGLSEKYVSLYHDEFPSIYERNKVFRFFTRWGPDNDQIIDDMRGKSLAEIVEYLKPVEYTGRHDLYDYQQALMTILEKNEDLIYENISLYDDLSHKYFTSVIKVITKLNNIEKIDQSLEIYSMMVDAIIKDTANIETLTEIYNSLENLTLRHEEKFTCFHACNLVLDSLRRTENYFLKDYSNSYEDQIYAILNIWFCVGIRYILRSAINFEEQSLKRKSMEWLNSLLAKKSKNISLIKGTLIYYLSFINLIDKSWIDEYVDIIFDSYDSTIIFLYTNVWPKEIYPNLVNKGYFKRVLNIEQNNKRDQTEVFKSRIAGWSMFISIDNNIPPDEILVQAVKLNSITVLCGLLELLSDLLKEREKDKNVIYERLIWLCGEVVKLPIDPENDYDFLLRHFADSIFELDEVDAIIWDCMNHLAEGFKHFLSDELYVSLNKHLDKYTVQVVGVVKTLIKTADDRALMMERDFDKLITRIKNIQDLHKEFIEINNMFISHDVYRFNDN